jgi:hypothetical protein
MLMYKGAQWRAQKTVSTNCREAEWPDTAKGMKLLSTLSLRRNQMADRYGTGPEASDVEDTAGHNPTVGSSKGKSGSTAGSVMKTPSGYRISGYKRGGTQHSNED